MRSRRRFWWAISLAIGPLVVAGCASETSFREIDGVPGRISGRTGTRGIVIAAPHGTSDARTGDIVAELARRTGFGVVIATGLTSSPTRASAPAGVTRSTGRS